MHQIIHLVLKEWRLLLRNPQGLATLFLMPAVFVLVMSFTLKNTLSTAIELPSTGWVLEQTNAASAQWARQWQARHGGTAFTSRAQLQQALATHQVQAGVIVGLALPGQSEASVPQSEAAVLVKPPEIWLGHRVHPAAAARLRAELSFSLLQGQMQSAAAAAGPFASVLLSSAEDADQNELLSARHAPSVRYLYEIESGRVLTAVQQSVPAWLVFGMFFVVIPLAGVLIQERNDGTLTRLANFGVSPTTLLGGKLCAYMLLNWGQLFFMLAVGRVLVPLLGGDALDLHIAALGFVLMVLATSVAAVGLALLIATWTHRFEHAAALGGGLNVVLAAIAGVMVPRALMPPALQTLSASSPMGWALDGLQAVFLGNPETSFLLPRAALLLGFGVLCLRLSQWRLRHQEQPR